MASSSATKAVKNDAVCRHKDTVRVSRLTNRPINPQKPPKVDIYWCEPCKMKLTNPLASLKHFTGHDHSVAVSKANTAAKKMAQASKKVGAQSSDLKRKQDPKVSATPAKVAKANTASAYAGAAAAAAKKKPATTPPAKTNMINRGSKRGGGATASSRPSFNNKSNFNYNNNSNNQRSNFSNGNFNNQRNNTFQNNNNQRNSNFNNNNNQRNLNFGGFNLSRNNQSDNSYPQSYIRESAGMNRNIGGDNSYTWQQQQQFGAEINNMLAQRQLNNLQREVSNLEMLQQRLMRVETPASLLRGNNSNNNNNRGGVLRGDSFGGNRSGREGFWGR